jgi:hypothetical protein
VTSTTICIKKTVRPTLIVASSTVKEIGRAGMRGQPDIKFRNSPAECLVGLLAKPDARLAQLQRNVLFRSGDALLRRRNESSSGPGLP